MIHDLGSGFTYDDVTNKVTKERGVVIMGLGALWKVVSELRRVRGITNNDYIGNERCRQDIAQALVDIGHTSTAMKLVGSANLPEPSKV